MAPSRSVLIFIVFFGAMVTPDVQAQDDPLHLMREPATITDVADAMDGEDPFDMNVSVGYSRRVERATITREIGGGTTDIADYEREVQRLNLGMELGLFRDISLSIRVPFVLSDERRLGTADGRTRSDIDRDLCHVDSSAGTLADCDVPTTLGDDSFLFRVPTNSTTRSGIEYIAAGLNLGLMNQARDPHLATWVLSVEGRFGVGDAMAPCVETSSGRVCGQGASSTGMNAETAGLRIESRASRRFRYFEPYGVLGFQIDWPTKDGAFTPTGDLSGFTNTLPPRQGEVRAGVYIIPWENRESWQRFALDFQFIARYVSEGHTRSPLFDALGASSSPYLTSTNLEGVPDEGNSRILREVPFMGLTDVQPHARIGGRFGLDILAARYVRFEFFAAVFFDTPHFITYADACNPNETPTDASDPRAGTCVRGIINPHHRAALDLPGQRFRLEESLVYDIGAAVTARF
jgi:hypothetical protein